MAKEPACGDTIVFIDAISSAVTTSSVVTTSVVTASSVVTTSVVTSSVVTTSSMQCKILIVISLMQSAFYSITVGVLCGRFRGCLLCRLREFRV